MSHTYENVFKRRGMSNVVPRRNMVLLCRNESTGRFSNLVYSFCHGGQICIEIKNERNKRCFRGSLYIITLVVFVGDFKSMHQLERSCGVQRLDPSLT